MLGERLVVYLAVFDLLISVTHAVDHLYWVARLNIAFESFCVVAGLLLQVSSTINQKKAWTIRFIVIDTTVKTSICC